MNAFIAKHFTPHFAHEKIGNGNKRVIARVEGDVNQIFITNVYIGANGHVTVADNDDPLHRQLVVKQFYINISTGTTNEPNFVCVVHELKDVHPVRRITLPKNVNEIYAMRFSANARKFCVACKIDTDVVICLYDTFDRRGDIVKSDQCYKGDNYNLVMNSMLT